MERTIVMLAIFIIAFLLIVVVTIFLYGFIQKGQEKIEVSGQKIRANAEIVGGSVSTMNIAKIDIQGNFTPEFKERINIPELLKKGKRFNKIIRMYGYPQFEVNILTVDDPITGVKPIVYAVTYNNEGDELYSTAGDEIIYKKNAFWINFVEFTCYNDRGNEVGVTLLSGAICGKVDGVDKCFYRINIFLHEPTISLENEVAPELPELPENIEIK